MAKRRGRPKEVSNAQNNADRVFLALARDRTLAKLGPDLEGVANPLSGKPRKGQQDSPRPYHKAELSEAAAKLGISPRTLERHCLEHGAGSLERVVEEITARLNTGDKRRAKQIEFLACQAAAALRKGDTEKVLKLAARIARIRQGQGEVSRNK